jgi:hypothetical protein
LIYPLYSSRIADPAREDSRITLTNLDSTRHISVRLFFIPDDAAATADSFICLKPNQTTAILASAFDPNITGYVIALAVDPQTGCPINFNFLIGDVFVKLSSGHQANLRAESFAALVERPAICEIGNSTAEIKFDGIHYQALPKVLAASHIPSPPDGNLTLLVIDRLGGNLSVAPDAPWQIIGVLFDDLEKGYSFEFKSDRRQCRMTLSNTFPRTSPRISRIIPSGQSGWLKLWSEEGLVGAILNFNSNSQSSSAAFNHGRNLHRMTFSNKVVLNFLLATPRC